MSLLNERRTSYVPMPDDTSDYDAFSGISDCWDHFALHSHDFFEFYLFYKGIPYFCLDEQTFPLKPCTLVILPPFHLHGVLSTYPTTEYERSWLYVAPALMQTVGFGLQDFSEFFKECVEKGRVYFYIDQATADKLRALIVSISEYVHTDDTQEKWRASLHVAEFLSMAYDIARNSETNCKPVVINETMQSVLAYINNHYTEDLSLNSLSKRFGLSSSYMSRSFSAYTGRSIYDYILYRRIMLAKKIISAERPFMEVAFECGFNDYSCFLRAFSKFTGKTPREYKNYISSLGLQL